MGITTYILQYDREFSANFNDNETAYENLARIIPSGISRNLLPDGMSVDHIELDYGEKTLNLKLPLKEQGVKEFEVLNIRDLSKDVKLSVRFKPDNYDESIESVFVKPKGLLSKSKALLEFSEKLKKEYTFFGRRLRKYNLIYNRKKLDLNSSLISQGIRQDIEVLFKPRIWFEWPPRLIWPPPPITTYLIGLFLLVIIGVMVNFYFINPISEFDVTITCNDCRIYSEDDDFLGVDSCSIQGCRAGDLNLVLYPKRYPIQNYSLELKSKGRLLPFWDDELSKIDKEVTLDKEYAGLDTIGCILRGFYFDPYSDNDKKLPAKTPILINNYSYETTNQADTFIVLYEGIYEIQYKIDKSLLREIDICGVKRKFTGAIKARGEDLKFDIKKEIQDCIPDYIIEFRYNR